MVLGAPYRIWCNFKRFSGIDWVHIALLLVQSIEDRSLQSINTVKNFGIQSVYLTTNSWKKKEMWCRADFWKGWDWVARMICLNCILQ